MEGAVVTPSRDTSPGAATSAPGDDWTGRRVLVTGHTGFKGAWLSLLLERLGAVVGGFSLDPPTAPSLFRAAGVTETVDHVVGDVRDLGAVTTAVADFAPEVVLHLAAQPLVRRSYEAPIETYATNVMGTMHVLEAVRAAGGVGAVVVVTSDKCYENREWEYGYRETDRLGGSDPYSSSKAAVELLVGGYVAAFLDAADASGARPARTGVATARAGNVIGGGDWAADRLVPDLVRGVVADDPALIRNPAAVRPWQHVLEPLAGYLRLASSLLCEPTQHAGAWNFGPAAEDAWPVAQVADHVGELWGTGPAWVTDDREHPHEAHDLRLDWSKARRQLGWRPRWDLASALRRTVAWYRDFYDGTPARELTLRDIDDYLKGSEPTR